MTDLPELSREHVRASLGGLDWREAYRERLEEIAAALRSRAGATRRA
jgi:hypothetical protein